MKDAYRYDVFWEWGVQVYTVVCPIIISFRHQTWKVNDSAVPEMLIPKTATVHSRHIISNCYVNILQYSMKRLDNNNFLSKDTYHHPPR